MRGIDSGEEAIHQIHSLEKLPHMWDRHETVRSDPNVFKEKLPHMWDRHLEKPYFTRVSKNNMKEIIKIVHFLS